VFSVLEDIAISQGSKLQSALSDRKNVILENRLYTSPFDLSMNTWQSCSYVLNRQSLAMFYLAAAVSDFYVPKSKRSEHKIQSAGGGLTLELAPVPKVMGLLRSTWASDAFVCSFKLETDRARRSERFRNTNVIWWLETCYIAGINKSLFWHLHSRMKEPLWIMSRTGQCMT
jgi:hypothetical protein